MGGFREASKDSASLQICAGRPLGTHPEYPERQADLVPGLGDVVKACASFDCEVVDFGLTGDAAPMPTSLWLWSVEGSTVSAVVKGEPFDTRNFTVVAACHADSKDLSFQSIKRDVFENKAKDIGDCTALR